MESFSESPVLSIIRHDSFGQELVSKNGVQKDVQLAAKNLPITVAIKSAVDLRTVHLWAQLVYDAFDGCEFKPVDQVKVEPMHYKVHVEADGTSAAVEARIQVLTSQHEDSLFRVKIIITDSSQNSCSVCSDPIRVLSKPSQVAKYLEKCKAATSAAKKAPKPSSPATSGVKRNAEDVLDVLARLEEEQRESKKLITQLVMSQKLNSPPATDFDSAFQAFIDAFKNLSELDKMTKTEAIMQDKTFSDIINRCNDCKRSPCETCPYKEGAHAVERFCEDFLFPDF